MKNVSKADLHGMLKQLAFAAGHINAVQHAGNPVTPEMWSHLDQLTNQAKGMLNPVVARRAQRESATIHVIELSYKGGGKVESGPFATKQAANRAMIDILRASEAHHAGTDNEIIYATLIER